MTGMESKAKTIISGICCLFVIAIFIYGMSSWQNYSVKKDGTILGNLYYITIASCLMMTGLIIRISAKGLFYKLCGCALYSLFYVNLFIELKRTPTSWNIFDALFQVPVFMGIISFEILLYVIDKNKNNER